MSCGSSNDTTLKVMVVVVAGVLLVNAEADILPFIVKMVSKQ